MITNLPSQPLQQIEVKQFFDRFYINQISFPSNQIDALVGFFLKRNFDEVSAASTAIVLLNQAYVDNINVFQLLDTLRALPSVQLTQVVAQIINSYREKTSHLGYQVSTPVSTYDTRNILV